MKSSSTAPEDNAGTKPKSRLRENVEAILLAVLLALFIRTFIVQAFKIPSGSMEDTLLIGDHILVSKFIYGIRMPFSNATVVPIGEPKRGDIVVFKFPQDPKMDFIKRVVGIPGDVVECRNKVVYVNGRPEDNNHAVHKDAFIIHGNVRDNFGPINVPEDSLFVMGDNRDRSNDSRYWKFVKYSQLRGKAFMIYWSWDKEDFAVRWRRIGDLLH
ncbi:MAG: signal peptidase I [Desulfobacterales bacterium]|nr:signal peptidase I [Desulfobacterales bacterium]